MSQSYISASLRRLVYERAAGRCEYCLVQESNKLLSHQIDHIVAEQHGGKTDEDNLALSCFWCNCYKGPNISSIDWETGEGAFLFNPRRDLWDDHFVLEGAYIQPLTSVGRATLNLLRLNEWERLNVRQALYLAGLYP